MYLRPQARHPCGDKAERTWKERGSDGPLSLLHLIRGCSRGKEGGVGFNRPGDPARTFVRPNPVCSFLSPLSLSLSLSGVHIVRYAPSATHCSRSGRYPGVSTLVILFSPWPHPAAQAAVKAQASLANCPDQRARSVGNGSFDVSQATDNIETEHWCPGQACYCCCRCRTADADSRPRSSLRRQAAASVRHMR